MLEIIRSDELYEDLVKELESGDLGEEEIESFVNEHLKDLERGKNFRYNEAFSVLAVSINDADVNFEDEFFVKKLAELNSVELGEASRIAEACIKESSFN